MIFLGIDHQFIHFPPRAQVCASCSRLSPRVVDTSGDINDNVPQSYVIFNDFATSRSILHSYSREDPSFDYLTAACLRLSMNAEFERRRTWSVVITSKHDRLPFTDVLIVAEVSFPFHAIMWQCWFYHVKKFESFIFHLVRRFVPCALASPLTLWTQAVILTMVSRRLTWYSMISRWL